ncbi:MAG: lamin tail domain-containing protein, partial [Verrucomicrobiae bacterium]|nr:lamin tail domain-containing protein [Verrucomicrobiae bacterium]
MALAGSAAASPLLSEFMAANDSWLADEDGVFADWIEICNPDTAPLSLAGYHLTDDPADLRQWTFPEVTLDPGACLVVFASGKNRTDPGGELHTNFRLAAEGDYLALVAPDGVTLVTAFAPAYPDQFDNESFGIAQGSSPPEWTFFPMPTPGAPNGNGVRAGPVVQVLEPNPPQPVTGPLTVMARVSPANDPVAEVTLSYRRMFSVDTLLAMRDDGTGEDTAANDGV